MPVVTVDYGRLSDLNVVAFEFYSTITCLKGYIFIELSKISFFKEKYTEIMVTLV